MKPMNSILLSFFILQAVFGVSLWAQVEGEGDIITPTPKVQGPGGVTPYFWLGIQTIFSAGYNMETEAAGFWNLGGDNYTWASFNVVFVDSHYDTPKLYEVANDPNVWSGKFKLLNFTARMNNYDTREVNNPAWLAEISGKGAHIGFFTQAGTIIGWLSDTQNESGSATPKPFAKISAGNKVLNLGDNDLGQSYYNGTIGVSHETVYTTPSNGNGAVMYAGYEWPNLFNAYITGLSEGNVNSNTTPKEDGSKIGDGIAIALDFGVSPFGLITDDENPLTFNLTGNMIGGYKFETTSKENFGFGLKAEQGTWLGIHNFVLSPVMAFDGRLDTDNDFIWKLGGGLTFQFSGMRWVSDDWNEIKGITNYDVRYENEKILKYAYAQVYAAYSEKTDFDMVFKVEEPDGNTGFHDKLGAMLELRLYNLTNTVTTNTIDWAMQGRVSYDFNVKSYLISPYVRAYLDSDAVFKLRLGAQANIIPYTGFEIAYTSANLNNGATTTDKPMNHYNSIFDAGRLELIVVLKSDDPKPKTPKRMNFWNYNSYINGVPDTMR